jgi:NAD(P)H-hydrate epimerase
MKIATREIVREIDARSIEKHGIPGLLLMENAGRMAADVVLEEFPQVRTAAVFAGGGNNGGDGFVIARHLIGQGIGVKTYLAVSSAKYKGDALSNLKALRKSGGEIIELGGSLRKYTEADIIVDALFGTGLDREVEGFNRKIIDFMNARPVPRLAVDLPSGIDANTGFPLGAAVRADVTVTFVMPKIGISIYPGLGYAGRIFVADITTPKYLEDDVPYELLTNVSVSGILKPRLPDTHKGTYGHLFILAGTPGKTGAATLASLGALRVGTGLVTVGIPASLNDIMEVKTTEAMTEPLPETDLRTLGPMSVKRAKEIIANKKTALAIGPGISTTEETRGFLYEMIRSSEIPCVIDADALTLIAEEPGILLKAKAPLVLTPHPGEMSRLAGIPTDEIERDRLGVSLEFASRYKVILVLKGARSLVTTPGGRVYVNTSGNPGMASGGMGDVLTGIIGGFLAQRIPPEDAARLGVFVHGLAGDIAARERGQAGIIAGDLADVLPRTLAALPDSDEEPFFRIR